MRALLPLLFSLALPAFAQVHATLTKVSLSGTQAIFGKVNKTAQAGVWILSMEPLEQGTVSVPRERIIAAFPEIPLYPNGLGQDVIDAKVAGDPRTIRAALIELGKRLIPAGLAIGGLVTKTDSATYIGLGIGAALEIADLIIKSNPPPDPRTKYYSQFCPESPGNAGVGVGPAFVVPAGGGITCYITSGLVHDPPNTLSRDILRPTLRSPVAEVETDTGKAAWYLARIMEARGVPLSSLDSQ